MKKLLLALTLISAACSSVPARDDVVAMSVDDLKADSAAIAGHRYISTGQPDVDLLRLAKEAGITTVVDLRTPDEPHGIDEPTVVESLGMQYVSFPISGAADVTFPHGEAFSDILSKIDGPVLLHCRSGNRVGAMFALKASIEGASDEDALAVGHSAGLTSLEKAVTEALGQRD